MVRNVYMSLSKPSINKAGRNMAKLEYCIIPIILYIYAPFHNSCNVFNT